jgi:hypothetical protein
MSYYRGLILVSPHGTYIKELKKVMIIKVKKLESIINKKLLLIENKKALGYIKLSAINKINKTQFNKLKDKHMITDKERNKWWPNKNIFYAYPVSIIKFFKYPKNINYKSGPQILVKPESIY